jgi:HAMP domain-containing protein
MKFRINIAFRIGIGFGIIILALIISAFFYSGNIHHIRIIQLTISAIGLIIAVLLIRSLVNPIKKIKKVLFEMSKGDLPKTNLPEGTDEVGQMATALNALIRNLKSGLGEDWPRSLLITPLKLNEETHGVAEIASMREFLPHQIEFVERICNSIASSLSATKLITKDDDQTPLSSVILSGNIPEEEEKIKLEIKKVHFIREQLVKREKELNERVPDKESNTGNKI